MSNPRVNPKVVIVTPVDLEMLERLDTYCKRTEQTRAEAVRGALNVILQDGPAPDERRRAMVLDALKQLAPQAVRAGSVVKLLYGRASRTSVFCALDELVKLGHVEKLERPAGSKYKGGVYRVAVSHPSTT